MRQSFALLILALAIPALGLRETQSHHQRRRLASAKRQTLLNQTSANYTHQTQSVFLNHHTAKFFVNGSAIPHVDFDVGESYAGLLPIGNDTSSELYFWFFPSTNPIAKEKKEILIYLTGGPGCSSIGELLQQNGPVLWQQGTAQPIQNQWSWHRLTNVVWIDQPVGTGFSQGTPTATREEDVAEQFLGWWKNFVDTFALQGFTVYVTGSSYGGMYAPFISSAMLDQDDTTYFNVSGMAVWDGLYSKIPLTEDIPVAAFVDKWKTALPFNDTFMADIEAIDEQCGYTAYLDEFLVFPPAGPQPAILPGEDPFTGLAKPECVLYIAVFLAAKELNPCLNLFDVTSHCPVLFDPLGFAAGHFTTSLLPTPYFNLPTVKSALHAPQDTKWTFCQNPLTNPIFANNNTDLSLASGPGSQPVLPGVIERTGNVILGHGSKDFLVLPEATLLTIQNLTWSGEMGFKERPEGVLFVPSGGPGTGAGVVGESHTERGLTWFGAAMAGHLLAMDQPRVAFRMVEVLLGRVEGFESVVPFTVEMGEGGEAGVGTVEMG